MFNAIDRFFSSWRGSSLTALLFFVLDYLSKAYVYARVPFLEGGRFPYGGIPLFQNFLGGINGSINYVANRGAAWGFFSQYPHLLLYFRMVAIIAILFYTLLINQKKLFRFPLLLLSCGALGNVIDYFLYGHVVDFFHFTFWGYSYPLFNLADSMIFTSVVFLFVYTSLKRRSEKKEAQT